MIAKNPTWSRADGDGPDPRIEITARRCPECGMQPPVLRLPDSLQQALLGGWTCEDCGCVMDRRGRRLGPDASVRIL